MNRVILINHYLSKSKGQKYLEIGVYKGTCLNNISANIKDSVDPDHSTPALYKVTSDEFFEKIAPTLGYKYDVIFIDGLHHSDQVDKDIQNSLLFLEDDGVILLHDCNPISEMRQRVPADFDIWKFGWNGDVWKSIVKFRKNYSYLKYNTFVIDADEGLGVIENNKKGIELKEDISEQLTYNFLESNRIKLLNLISPLDFIKPINTCIFTTHTTLDLKHADYSLKSLLSLQTNNIIWDNFIIYNTHEHELPNENIIDLIKKYDVKNYIKNILLFPYDPEINKKNLLQDIRNWFDIGLSLELQNNQGKILWLKSDYCVSNNFNKIFLEHNTSKCMWSLPTLGAKQKINYDQILTKLNLSEFTPSDFETYYRGGDNPNNQIPNEEISPNGEMDYHPSINYVSHNYVHDFNLHVISNDILELGREIAYHPQVFDMNSTWGGPHNLFYGLKQNGVYFSGEYRAYGIHMFHEIISENRLEDRGDDRKLHFGEKY
jgi:hypothetical protein